VVELDDGSFVKANLLDTTDANDIQAGARVALATFVAATDDDGTEAVAFGFRLEDTDEC
jgi:predicted RecA/RadA family phage recombinase